MFSKREMFALLVNLNLECFIQNSADLFGDCNTSLELKFEVLGAELFILVYEALYTMKYSRPVLFSPNCPVVKGRTERIFLS